jgi:hypothetical protein
MSAANCPCPWPQHPHVMPTPLQLRNNGLVYAAFESLRERWVR